MTGRQPGLDRLYPGDPAPSRRALTPALCARVVVPGVPPNLPNQRLYHMERARLVRQWRAIAWNCAHSARNEAHWPLLERAEKAPRWLQVDIYKLPPLYDPDGAVSCLKPLVDGMVGVLLVDDSEQWCRWTRMPEQHAVGRPGEQRVELQVFAVDPRRGE